MTIKMKNVFVLLSLSCFCSVLQPQVVKIASGTSMLIKSGTSFTADNMTLLPSADFTLTNVNLSKNATVTNSTSATYVSRVYKFSATTPSYSGTIRINYLVGELNSLTESSLQVNVHNGIAWNPYTSATNDATNHYVVSNAVASLPLNEIAVGSSASPLPVELVSFTAEAAGKNVELRWSTATEVNNAGFEVQRSQAEGERKEWIGVGFVEGHGTTNAPQAYTFSDNPGAGAFQYRLKQIDRDGKFEYSQAVEVTAISTPKEFALAQNYPNPFNPTTAISYQLSAFGFTTLKVYDAIGREVATLVNEVKEAGTYSAQFDGAKLSSGIYFAKLSSSGKTQIRKLVLMK